MELRTRRRHLLLHSTYRVHGKETVRESTYAALHPPQAPKSPAAPFTPTIDVPYGLVPGPQMELKGEMSQKVDVQLGILLDKRRIKIGQVVGTWACIRIGELRKDEFRLQVQILGLDAPPAAIDAFFDSIDANRNGWLDVKEAGSAMKVLQEKAARARAQHDELVEEVKSLQLSAARKVMRALRPPPSSDKAVAFSDQEGAAGGSADELSDEADVLAVNADGSLAQRGETRSERKARDAERQKRVEDIAQKAMRRITQMALAKGWQTWQGW
jgi:hypothetical protein